jgi:hypothetical protein
LFLKHLVEFKDKIRFVPISTKRPSLAECSRIAKTISTVVRIEKDEDEDKEEEHQEEEEEESLDDSAE